MMRRLLALLALAVGVSPAIASNQTVYVRSDGSDNPAICSGLTNAGTANTPDCAKGTPNGAINLISGSGNTILVVGPQTIVGTCVNVVNGWLGTATAIFAIPSGKNGTAAARNVIKVLVGTGTVTINGPCGHAAVVASNFWDIGGLGTGEGFTIGGNFDLNGLTAQTNGVIFQYVNSGNNLRILGNTFTGNLTAGLDSSSIDLLGEVSFRGTPAGEVVQNNTFTLRQINTAIQGGNASTCLSDCSGCSVAGWEIRNNTIRSGDATRRQWGIESHGSRSVTVDSNFIEIGTAASPNTFTAGGGGPGGILSRNGCDWTITNNYISLFNAATGRGVYFYDENGDAVRNHILQNNTIYGNMDTAVYYGRCKNCDGRNNLVRGAGALNEAWRDGGSSGCGTLGSTGPIGYNSLTNTTSGYIQSGGTPGLCPQRAAADDQTANDRTANPNLNGTGALPIPFLQLTASSTDVIDHGCNRSTVCTNAPSLDYDGSARSNPGDIGADEQAAGAPGDTTPPAAVVNLAVLPGGITSSSVVLTWTAPGDDGNTGTATSYDIRYATSAITSDTLFNAATAVTGEPTPSLAGSSETFTVTGLLASTTYWFAIRTLDEVPNTSALSNSPSGTTLAAGAVNSSISGAVLNGVKVN